MSGPNRRVGAYAPKGSSRTPISRDGRHNDASDRCSAAAFASAHIADETEATSDLAAQAAQQGSERANLVREDIEFIAVGTTTPDMIFPSVGNSL